MNVPVLSVGAENASPNKPINVKATAYLRQRTSEYDQIPTERKTALKQLAAYIEGCLVARQPVRLIFICTHNSRRSHMSQIWAAEAANFYAIPGVECFSGGTEATAFNPRAVAALERAGLEIAKSNEDQNPRYLVNLAEGLQLACFSKKYSDAANPAADFGAVMTCSNADKACPTVSGAALRVAIPFEDPKVSDDSPQEVATYDARCAQICREMLYVFSQVHVAR